MGRLENRVAIVTGSSGYLGRTHAVFLAREGAKIVVADIVDGSETVRAIEEAGSEAVWVRTDVSDAESTQVMAQATLDRFGRIDVLVNNAAIVADISKPWTEISPEEWRRNIDVDLTGMFLCARAVYPAMREAGWPHRQHLLGHHGARIPELPALRLREGGGDRLYPVPGQ